MIHPQLKTFLTVCEKGSFTKAAGVLFITPSAVMQQMNALEERLKVRLLFREKGGIRLTKAGELLREEGGRLLRREEEVKERLREIHAGEEIVNIGTSMLEKSRLLYDLWMLYLEEAPGMKIGMVSISPEAGIGENIDLIESLHSNLPWMKDWDFLPICQMPFGFAFDRRHPLASKGQVSLSDLKGETVLCFENASCEVLREMFLALE